MKVVIAGSREYPYMGYVREWMFANLPPCMVITGGARGVDTVAYDYAGELGLDRMKMPADWEGQGRSAGYRRNEEMVNLADHIVVFWDGKSKGSKHTIDIAARFGKLWAVFSDIPQL